MVAALSLGVLLALSGCDRGRPHLRGKSLQEWLDVVRDSNPDKRLEAATALVELAAKHSEAEHALVDALSDGSVDVRLVAARAFVELGPRASGANEQLQRMVAKEQDASVRATAAMALGSTTRGENWGVMSLRAALRDSSSHVRAAAAEALAIVGSPARGALQDLVAVAQYDTEVTVRLAARSAVNTLTGSR